MRNFTLLLFFFATIGNTAFSQGDSTSHYDQHTAFHPLFYPSAGNEYRSAGGQPGPAYWQNRADYKIISSLDTAQHVVKGSVVITYKNNSPMLYVFCGCNLIKISTGKTAGHRLQLYSLAAAGLRSHLPKEMN